MKKTVHRWFWMGLGLLLLLPGCTTARVQQENAAKVSSLQRYEFAQPQMGVPFRMVFYAPNQATAEAAATAAFARIQQLNQIMSDYEDDSELTLLSRTAGQGKAVPLSPDLWNVLEQAQRLSRKTDGAFDVTVGPCVMQWRRARRQRKLPTPEVLQEVRQAVGYQHLRLNRQGRTAQLMVPKMRLDLGGIAKGYAVDAALQVLRSHGIDRALVAGAGDMAAGAPPPGQNAWQIALGSLDEPGAPPARTVLLTHAALATSGDTFQYVEIDGQRYSHIVDPRTCIGLTDHSLVTVIARDCTTADSLATATSVLGPKKSINLIDQTPGAAIHIVRKPNDSIEVFESRHFSRFLKPGKASSNPSGAEAP